MVEVEKNGAFMMAIFADSDATRDRLSPNLRSLRIPTINDERYWQPFIELVALSWDALLKSRMARAHESEVVPENWTGG